MFSITCYGKTKLYPERDRGKMACQCLRGVSKSGGCNQNRYMNIYTDLITGMKDCRDIRTVGSENYKKEEKNKSVGRR